MRGLRCGAYALAALGLAAVCMPANASLLITIDKEKQHMIVALDDLPVYDWPVSTGQRGYDTPVGEFKPFRMEKDHFSREWDDAPMPNSIFFTQEGHAIHGSFAVKNLGSPASHGCVRLSPQNAATLFALVKQEKMANTRVVLTGVLPAAPAAAVSRNTPRRAPAPTGDDTGDGFTASLSPVPNALRAARQEPPQTAEEPQERQGAQERRQRPARETRPRAAFFDGRYYYDRSGRRLEGAAPRYAGRTYYERPPADYEPPRARGLFER